MDRRAELHGWIANTHALQRRMAFIYGGLVPFVLVLMCWHVRIGAFALILVALVAVCSFWVTAAHNAAHRQKLAELARRAR